MTHHDDNELIKSQEFKEEPKDECKKKSIKESKRIDCQNACIPGGWRLIPYQCILLHAFLGLCVDI